MRIAIIGGGIGGLTAALTLRQFGFEPEIFEQAPQLMDVGAAILMWPNAMRVLQRLGLADAVQAAGGVLAQGRWLRSDGRVLNQFSLPKSDVPAVAIHRAELQNILLNSNASESIRLDHVFDRYEQKAGVVIVHFKNQQSFECDALICADGLHSRARVQMLDDGPPIERNYVAWRGVVTCRLDSSAMGTATEVYGRGQRFGIGPLGAGKVGWWASANKGLLHGGERFDDAIIHEHHALVHENMEEIRDVVLRLFEGWCEPVLELVRTTPLTALVRNATLDRKPVRKWTNGCVTLIGDAIHPLTPNLGQGGCLAIEDAAVLARCFARYAGERSGGENPAAISLALHKFENLRFARCAWMERLSRVYGNFGQWEGVWTTQFRGLVQGLVPKKLAASALRRVFDYDAFAVEA